MKRLPRFLRQWIALFKAWTSPEYGGIIYDYENGKMEELHRWDTDEGVNQAREIVEQMILGSHDEIYLTVVKCGQGKGYFILDRTGHAIPWVRAFWPEVYGFMEAYIDVLKQARKFADKMGFRRPEDTIGRAA